MRRYLPVTRPRILFAVRIIAAIASPSSFLALRCRSASPTAIPIACIR